MKRKEPEKEDEDKNEEDKDEEEWDLSMIKKEEDKNNNDTPKVYYFLKEPPQCGSGPWFVYLMVNIADSAIKKTEIKIHTYPNVVEVIQNKLHVSKNQIWRVIMAIGPFEKWIHSIRFCHQWETGTRGCKSRLIQGAYLFNKFKKAHDISIFLTPYTKNESQEIIDQYKKNTCIFNVLSEYQIYNNIKIQEEDGDNNIPSSLEKSNALNNFLEQFIINGHYMETLPLNKDDYQKLEKWWKLSVSSNDDNDHASFDYVESETDPSIKEPIFTKTLGWIFKHRHLKRCD